MAIFNTDAVNLVRAQITDADKKAIRLLRAGPLSPRYGDDIVDLIKDLEGEFPFDRIRGRLNTRACNYERYSLIFYQAILHAQDEAEAISLFCQYELEVVPGADPIWVPSLLPPGRPILSVRLPTCADYGASAAWFQWDDGKMSRNAADRWGESAYRLGKCGPSAWTRDQERASHELRYYLQKSQVTLFKHVSLATPEVCRLDKETIEDDLFGKKLRDWPFSSVTMDEDQMYRGKPPIWQENFCYTPPPETGFGQHVNGGRFTSAPWTRRRKLVGEQYPHLLFTPLWKRNIVASVFDVGNRDEPGVAQSYLGRWLRTIDIIRWDSTWDEWYSTRLEGFTILLRDLRESFVGSRLKNRIAAELEKIHRRNFPRTYPTADVQPVLWWPVLHETSSAIADPQRRRGIGSFESWVSGRPPWLGGVNLFITAVADISPRFREFINHVRADQHWPAHISRFDPNDDSRPLEKLFVVQREAALSRFGWRELFDESTWPADLSDWQKKERRRLRLLVREIPVKWVGAEADRHAEVDWDRLPDVWEEAPAGGWAGLPPGWPCPPDWTGLPEGVPGLPAGWPRRIAFTPDAAGEVAYKRALKPVIEEFLYKGNDGLFKDWKVYCLYFVQTINPNLLFLHGQLSFWALYYQESSLMNTAAQIERFLDSPVGRTVEIAGSAIITLSVAVLVPLLLGVLLPYVFLEPWLHGLAGVCFWPVAAVLWFVAAYVINQRMKAMKAIT